jgi:hypothetical protein
LGKTLKHKKANGLGGHTEHDSNSGAQGQKKVQESKDVDSLLVILSNQPGWEKGANGPWSIKNQTRHLGRCKLQWLNVSKNYIPYKSIQDSLK